MDDRNDLLSALYDAFQRVEKRPAVFDRKIRIRVGQWTLNESVPADEILRRFVDDGRFATGDGTVVLPLHEPDSAEITGEYLLYHPDEEPAYVSYYDFSRDGVNHASVESLGTLYPAWRLRFFGEQFTPEVAPSYYGEFTPSAEADDAVSSGDSVPKIESGTPVADSEAFFEELKLEVGRDRETARSYASSTYANVAKESFLARYAGIDGVVSAGRAVDEYGQQLISLAIPPDHEAYENSPEDLEATTGLKPDLEILVDSSDSAGFPVEGTLQSIEDGTLELTIDWETADEGNAEAAFAVDSDARFFIGELLDPERYSMRRATIEDVENDDRKRSLLTGTGQLAFEDAIDPSFSLDRLNRYQTRAVKRAWSASDLFCIHAPPGSGERRTVIDLIGGLIEDRKTVLFCGPTDEVVDRFLIGESAEESVDDSSLHSLAERHGVALARTSVSGESAELVTRYESTDHWEADVVACPIEDTYRFQTDRFDVAVVVHASRLKRSEGIAPFAAAETCLLVGDHRQIGPPKRVGAAPMDVPSLFEHVLEVYGERVHRKLRCQYRMNEAIALFPNREFYGNELIHGQNNRTWTVPGLDSLTAIDVLGSIQDTPTGTYYNDSEAAAVETEVARLLDCGVAPEDICVATIESGQISKIRVRLDAIEEGLADRIAVGYVEQFYDDAYDAVIVSFVGFNSSSGLTDPVERDPSGRALNTTMTRARKRLVLIGNWRSFSVTRDETEGNSTDRYWRLYRYLEGRGLIEEYADGSED